jgi:hypothetical protein
MKISCICRIQTKQHNKEIILYAIEAPHPLLEEDITKCATLVEKAYENGFFRENKGILIDSSYRDKFQMAGVYLPKEVPEKYLEKYNIIIGSALRLSGLTGKEVSKKEKALYSKHKSIIQLSRKIDEWIVDELYDAKNIENALDN